MADTWSISDDGTLVADDAASTTLSAPQDVSKLGEDIYAAEYVDCLTNCHCRCHTRYSMGTPHMARDFLGRLSLSFTKSSSGVVECSSDRCRAYKGYTFRMHYSAPRWLFLRMVHILCSSVGDPTFVLSAPRVVSQDSAIFEMARLGDLHGMQKAFSQKWASPLVITEHGETLIQETIHNGHPLVARFLMQLGADPNVDNDCGVLPAQEAWDYILRKGFGPSILEQYKILFDLSDDDLDDRGFTTIHKIVLDLISADDMARQIDKHKSIINVVDSTGRTALHWATLRNDLTRLRILLEFGANPNIKDTTWGNTPLDYSVRCPSADLTRALIEFGADVNSRTTCKWTPLYGCATYRKSKIPEAHVANARILVNSGAEINARDEDGVDSLMKAARQEVPQLAAYLIDEAGICLTNKDNMGLTALAYAIRRQSAQTLTVILDRGADYTLKDNRGNTVLHAAALEADLETVNVLTMYDLQGVDPDDKNADGVTAIDVALGRKDIVDGFMPVFTKMLAGIRATRREVKDRVGVHVDRRMKEKPIRRTARKVEELEADVGTCSDVYSKGASDVLEEESFHDAVEF